MWATSYRPDYAFLDVPGVPADDRMAHEEGVAPAPGLYVCRACPG
jgi:putative flavoprotein involved in K+ transport